LYTYANNTNIRINTMTSETKTAASFTTEVTWSKIKGHPCGPRIKITAKDDNAIVGTLFGAPCIGDATLKVDKSSQHDEIVRLLLERYERDILEFTSLDKISFPWREEYKTTHTVFKTMGYVQVKNYESLKRGMLVEKPLVRSNSK
jgi:hypothetical protein